MLSVLRVTREVLRHSAEPQPPCLPKPDTNATSSIGSFPTQGSQRGHCSELSSTAIAMRCDFGKTNLSTLLDIRIICRIKEKKKNLKKKKTRSPLGSFPGAIRIFGGDSVQGLVHGRWRDHSITDLGGRGKGQLPAPRPNPQGDGSALTPNLGDSSPL